MTESARARRFAEIQAEVEARNAAEAADPSLLWRRRGVEAARAAVLAERVVPAAGAAAFWAGFDEALPRMRSEDLLGRRASPPPRDGPPPF